MSDPYNKIWNSFRAGALLERWPKDGAGEPEEPAFLCACSCLDLSDKMRMSMLEAYGIPCLSTARGNGGFGRVVLGVSGEGVDLYVPKSLLEDAVALCKEENNEEL